jgi:2-oxoglutarate ferredoxin oxidoreductase subunit alpha
MDRGKILWEQDLEKIKEKWGRYLDSDGDGIPYRTVPGNLHPRAAYFARGTGHDDYAQYSEEPDEWVRGMARLKQKFETARGILPLPEVYRVPKARVGLISYGSTDPAVMEAAHLLENQGIPSDYLRVKAIPFHDDVKEFINQHDVVYVVEMNRDGQMKQILNIEYPQFGHKLVSVALCDGLPLSAKWIASEIKKHEVKS